MKNSLIVFFVSIMALQAQINERKIIMHGFLSQGYMKSTKNNYLGLKSKTGSFEFNEAGIGFSSQLTDELRGGMQLLSRDMGRTQNHQVYLDWAYVDYRIWDQLGVRVGKIKMPLGLYNEIRDVDALRTFVLLPQSVYDEGIRDFIFAYEGVGVYGNMSMPGIGDLDYDAYMGTLNIPSAESGFWRMAFDFMGREVVGSQAHVQHAEVSAQHVYGGGLVWNLPNLGMRLGGYGLKALIDMNGDYPEGQMHVDIDVEYFYTFSAEWMLDNLTLTGEYHARKYIGDVHARGMTVKMPLEFKGYYGQATYQVFDWLEAGVYYGIFHDTEFGRGPNDPDIKYLQKDLCGALRFNITPSWNVKLEGHLFDGATQVFLNDNPGGKIPDWNLWTVKSSVSF